MSNKPDPTITLSGDVSGSATMTDLGSVTINTTVADDSHNHVISNVDGLQAVLDAKETPEGAQAKVDTHANRTDNPHGVTKSQVGLGSVSNYGLATKAEAEAGTSSAKYMTPLRTKQAIDALQAVKSVAGKTGTVTLTKGDVGLSNVDNTSDMDKPISTAVQTALDGKVDNSRVLTDVPANAKFTDTTYSEISEAEIDAGTSSTHRTITGRRVKYILDKVLAWISGLTKDDIGLGNVDNTSDLNKPISTATQTALNLKANLASPTFTGIPKAPTATVGTNTTQIATTAFVQNAISSVGGGDMLKSQYDTNNDGSVDKADEINGITSAGNLKYYGTDSSGNAGFFDLPSGILSGSSLPSPGVAYRGKTFVLLGGIGVADVPYICLKKADDTYEWRKLPIRITYNMG